MKMNDLTRIYWNHIWIATYKVAYIDSDRNIVKLVTDTEPMDAAIQLDTAVTATLDKVEQEYDENAGTWFWRVELTDEEFEDALVD